jgi:hypothetical protein
VIEILHLVFVKSANSWLPGGAGLADGAIIVVGLYVRHELRPYIGTCAQNVWC